MLRTLKDSGRSISHMGMLYKQEHMFLLCGFNCGAIDSLRVCTELCKRVVQKNYSTLSCHIMQTTLAK